MDLILNENQVEAVNYINKFLNQQNNLFYLLLGAAGSGKSTVLSNIFKNNKYKIIYCAFTNKATQVLKKISEKYGTTIECLTIHKLLMLKPTYKNKVLEYEYVLEKIEYLRDYDIIVFDECSTISNYLYEKVVQSIYHILGKFDKSIKCIMTGDFWQLPPVNENSSIVFTKAISEKWNCIKLNKIMRCKNDLIFQINTRILNLIEKFKADQSSFIVDDYPHNMFDLSINRENQIYSYDLLYKKYVDLWKNKKVNDIIILSYSNKDCDKINFGVQNLLNEENNRPYIRNFYAGDRCCVKNVNNIYQFKKYVEETKKTGTAARIGTRTARLTKFSKNTSDEMSEISDFMNNINKTEHVKEHTTEHTTEHVKTEHNIKNEPENVYMFDAQIGTIYNGEIFDILQVEEINIHTKLNIYLNMIDKKNELYFNCQLLTIKRIDDLQNTTYKIINIKESFILEKLDQIKKAYGRHLYYDLLDYARLNIPALTSGYCITIYKSQGSEFNTVLINVNNIKNSCLYAESVSKQTIPNQLKKSLIKTTYTAISRATTDIYLLP